MTPGAGGHPDRRTRIRLLRAEVYAHLVRHLVTNLTHDPVALGIAGKYHLNRSDLSNVADRIAEDLSKRAAAYGIDDAWPDPPDQEN